MVSTCVFSPSSAEEVVLSTKASAGDCSGERTACDKQKYRKRKRGCRAGTKTKEKKRRAIERIEQQNIENENKNAEIIVLSPVEEDQVPRKIATPPPVIELYKQ